MSAENDSRRLTHRHVLATALALVWLSAALLQDYETPALGAELAAAFLIGPLTIWAVARHHVTWPQVRMLAIACAPVALMVVSSLRSADPRIALLGTPPQWQGLFLWLAALGWFIASVVGSDRSNLFLVSRVLAVAGVICSLWALGERLGLIVPYDIAIGNSMALFDNPLSFGQALTVTIASTLALAPRRGIKLPERLFWLACVLLQLGALITADARAAVFGIVMGAVAYGFTDTGSSPLHRWIQRVSVAGAIAFVIAFGALSLAWNGTFGPAVFERVDLLLTDRLSVWTQVAEETASHMTLGSGPAAFDAVVQWNVLPGGAIDEWFTYAEHSILLEWIMDTGLLGFVLFGAAAVMVAIHLYRLARAESVTPSIRILVAGCVATFVAMLASWPDPLTLISISVIAGSLLPVLEARGPVPKHVFPVSATGAAAIAVASMGLALGAAYWMTPDLVAQYQMSQEADHHTHIQHLQRALARTHEPIYLEEQLLFITTGGTEAYSDAETVALLRNLSSNYPKAARGRVDIPALALEVLWMRSHAMPKEEFWWLTRFFARQGRRSSPNLGLWNYAEARAAVLAGRRSAPYFIRKARASEIPDSARSQLDAWAAQLDQP